ncbi:hypothetical protein D8T58_21195 [Vibrio vulnificus]|nr:hypothetical protein D8T58_21195 [Vibrio vulnificus]
MFQTCAIVTFKTKTETLIQHFKHSHASPCLVAKQRSFSHCYGFILCEWKNATRIMKTFPDLHYTLAQLGTCYLLAQL